MTNEEYKDLQNKLKSFSVETKEQDLLVIIVSMLLKLVVDVETIKEGLR